MPVRLYPVRSLAADRHQTCMVSQRFCCAQVELFCISKLINCLLDSDEEFVYMDCHFATGAALVLPAQVHD